MYNIDSCNDFDSLQIHSLLSCKLFEVTFKIMWRNLLVEPIGIGYQFRPFRLSLCFLCPVMVHASTTIGSGKSNQQNNE